MGSFTETLQAALTPTYELERELTGGGMSRVFVATDRALGRRVVVKVLPPDLAAGVTGDRFRGEIQLAALLQHPPIVPLLAAGEQDQTGTASGELPGQRGPDARARAGDDHHRPAGRLGHL